MMDCVICAVLQHQSAITAHCPEQDSSQLTRRLQPLATPQTPGLVEVRGKIYLGPYAYQALNQRRKADGEETFVSPGNAEYDSLRTPDHVEAISRRLQFVAYQLLQPECEENDELSAQAILPPLPATQWEALEWMESQGLAVVPRSSGTFTFEQALTEAQRWRAAPLQLPFDTHGCVFKLNDLRLQRQLGDNQYGPRYGGRLSWSVLSLHAWHSRLPQASGIPCLFCVVLLLQAMLMMQFLVMLHCRGHFYAGHRPQTAAVDKPCIVLQAYQACCSMSSTAAPAGGPWPGSSLPLRPSPP